MKLPKVVVLANCTHVSLALALRKSGYFSDVSSVEVYTVPENKRQEVADSLQDRDFILTLEHGQSFGPLSTAALRRQYGDRIFALPTPFFSGTMPDMAYLTLNGAISRAPGVLGDYHSALILAECADGRSEEEVVRRYSDGSAFDRFDILGVWNDGLAELRRRETNTEIRISDYILERKEQGSIGEDFLSFNHPREGLINHIACSFLRLALGAGPSGRPLLKEEHNLYQDARWPLHPTVAERLGLPASSTSSFKTPARYGAEELPITEFARRSFRFFTSEAAPADFEVNTPGYLSERIYLIATPHPTQILKPSMKQPCQIILTHFGRSGSTVLAKMLEQHPSIAWLHEIFSLSWQRSRETYNFTKDQLLEMVENSARRVWKTNPDKWVGHEIKLMNFLQNPSCNMVDYVSALTDPAQFRHVVLLRKNTLRRILSVYKAMQTNVYHSSDDAYRQSEARYSVNFSSLFDPDTGQKANTLVELIRKAQAREQSVLANYQKLGIEHLTLTYEDDIEKSPAKAYHRIVQWLGINDAEAKVTLSKTGAPLRQEILNYSQVADALSGTDFEWMLNETDF